jgi:hypothetical protein
MYSKGPPTTPSHPLRSYFIILENVLGVNPPRYTGIGFWIGLGLIFETGTL